MKLFDVYPINPINIVKGVGSLVYDDKGTEYLDLYGGHAVISIGHTNPHYVKRLEDQLHQIGFYSNSIEIPCKHNWPKSWDMFRVKKITNCSCVTRVPKLTRTR
jgi:acetylornithine/succinyldiaminopimelate/putrescine aminotransferase